MVLSLVVALDVQLQLPVEEPMDTSGDIMPADYGSGLSDLNPDDIESVQVLKVQVRQHFTDNVERMVQF
jgi:hypothetical protein